MAAPTVTSLSERVVGPGMEITIKGENFGLTGGKTFQVTVGGIVAADPQRVDDQTIKVKVPDGAASGDVLVTVEGVPGPTQPITVLKRLSLSHNYAQVVEGKSYAFTVTGHDTGEVLVEAPPVTWEVIEGTAVTVDAAGQIQAAAIGIAKVQVKRGAIASEPFTVEVMPFLYETSAFVGSGTAGGRNGQGAAADFDKPFEIALDSLGNLFVAELEGLSKVRIRKVTPDGTVGTYLSSNLDTNVGGFTVDDQDRVLVTDIGLNQILQVEPGNVLTPIAGRTAETTASDGDLLPGGPGTPANFETPMQITSDGAGKLYLADAVAAEQNNDWLREVSASGVVTISEGVPWSTAVPGVGKVWTVAADGAGSVYWASSPSQLDPCRLFRLKDGIPELIAGGGSGDGTGEAAGFGQITSIVFDADGNLILADNVLPFPGVTPSATVRRVTPAGVVTTIAGGAHGNVEGRGTSARFGVLEDLAMGADGTIYVADSGSKRIRKIKRVAQ
ncbi:MAG: IPT/TIG domain-containing protein [Candidatus Sericytochromatia bacterium]